MEVNHLPIVKETFSQTYMDVVTLPGQDSNQIILLSSEILFIELSVMTLQINMENQKLNLIVFTLK